MSKKHHLSKEEYENYLKRHRYEHPIEEEESKIAKELSEFQAERSTIKQEFKHLVRDLDVSSLEDFSEFDEAFEALEEMEVKSRKIRNNASTHKKRLKGIKKHRRK